MATEILTDGERVARFDAHWHQRIDGLISGACTEEAFVAEVQTLQTDSAESPWAVVALMDQRVRRGDLTGETFRAVESRIGHREARPTTGDLTVDLNLPAPPVITRGAAEPTEEELELAPNAGAEPPAAAAPIAEETLPIGSVVRDRYEISGSVEEGGLGTVYLAIDRFRRDHGETDCAVAIKVLLDSAAGHADALARLQREFYCAQSLAHRSIVKVFEIDRDGPVHFFTMEYLDGELLSHILGPFKWQPLPRDAAWSIIRELAEGLAHAHGRNVVHTDLKPNNVMILKSGAVRILAFGASSPGHMGQLTPAYASCELLAGLPPDPRDDLFALACLAYELLAGSHPFDYKPANEARALKLKPKRPPALTSRQWRVLEQGLAFDRENRWVTVRDWLKALDAGPSTLSGIPRPDSGTAAAPSRRAHGSSSSIRIVSLVGSIALIVVLGVIYFRQAPQQAKVIPALVTPAPKPLPAAEPVETPAPTHAAATPPANAPAAAPTKSAPAAVPPGAVARAPKPDHVGPAGAPSASSSSAAKVAAAASWQAAPPAPKSVTAPAASAAVPPIQARPVGSASAKTAPAASPPVRVAAAIAPAKTAGAPSPVANQMPPPQPPSAAAAKAAPAGSAAKGAAAAAAKPAKTLPVPARPVPGTPAGRTSRGAKVTAGSAFSVSLLTYRVPASAKFVEIKVVRSDASAPASVSWWTEDGSALAGIDYVGQPKTTAFFAAGTRVMALFIKTVGNPPRREPVTFTVQLGNPSGGVIRSGRTQVTLVPGAR